MNYGGAVGSVMVAGILLGFPEKNLN